MTEVLLARPAPVRRRLAGAGRSAFVSSLGRATAAIRPLPDFVILGAQRSGTTTLWRWLCEHPSMIPPIFGLKGVHYFDLAYDRPLSWYRGHFPSLPHRRWVTRRAGGARTGEASPYYLFHPAVPGRLGTDLPDTVFVVLLRNPVARALSHYHHMRIEGNEAAPTFEAAIDAESRRLVGQEEFLLAASGNISQEHLHHAYLARGHYAEQLKGVFEHVDRERVIVVGSERLFTDPHYWYAEILAFVGLSPAVAPPRPTAYNAGAYDALSSETVSRLEDYYQPHNERLAELLGEALW